MYPKEKELLLQSNLENVYSAWASIRLGIGNAAFKRLYSALGNAENIYKLSDYSEFGITEKQAKRLSEKDLNEAEKCISSSIDQGFIPISYGSEYYPKKLRQLSNPPSIIYCKGNVPDFDKYFCVGIVGTRAPSKNALIETYNLSAELAKKGILIISGIALGVDSQAHSAALVENGFTVGVSGVKAGQIYPKKNTFLYKKMYEDGLVICEHSPTEKVENGSFPKRNRIISALSDALIMVEAPIKSGAIITAQKSLSMKKAVFVPSWNSPTNEGGKALLNQSENAFMLNNEKDITDFFNCFNEFENKEYFSKEDNCFLCKSPKEKKQAKKNTPQNFFEANTSQNFFEEESKRADISRESNNNIQSKKNTTFSEENEQKNNKTENKNVSFPIVPSELTEMEKDVFLYISIHSSPTTDNIISNVRSSRSDTISAISMLEIYGYIKRLPGDRWDMA